MFHQESGAKVIVWKQTGGSGLRYEIIIIQANSQLHNKRKRRSEMVWDKAGSIFARDIEGLCDTLSEMESLPRDSRPDTVFSIRTLASDMTHDIPHSYIITHLSQLILCAFLPRVSAHSLHILSLSWEGRTRTLTSDTFPSVHSRIAAVRVSFVSK